MNKRERLAASEGGLALCIGRLGLMRHIGVGIIGGGSMCKLHSAAYGLVPLYFAPTEFLFEKRLLCDINPQFAQKSAAMYRWDEVITDWRDLVTREDIDLVDICSPNNTHKDIAISAAQNGKMIYCEKPLALTAQEAREMYEAARRHGVPTAVGFNKRRYPAVVHARNLVDAGYIGEPIYFRGSFLSSFALDPNAPRSWRFQKSVAGSGVLADLGSHLIDLCRYLIGDFREVLGETRTLYERRPLPGVMQGIFSEDASGAGETGEVDVEDACVFLARMASGALANFELTRISSGKNDGMSFELWGTGGSIRWDQQHAMELQLSTQRDARDSRGFKIVEMGGEHPYGKALWEVPGFGTGLSDIKSVEVHDFVDAALNGRPFAADFLDGLKVCQVTDAVLESARLHQWTTVPQ